MVIESRPAGSWTTRRRSTLRPASSRFAAVSSEVPQEEGCSLSADGRLALHGVTSTVDFDLSSNGLAPLSAVQDLLEQPSKYMHTLPEQHTLAAQPPTRRW